MNSEQNRARERREHSSTSTITRDAAIKRWRAADTVTQRHDAAKYVVANVTSYAMLKEHMGEEAEKVWTDAGHTVP